MFYQIIIALLFFFLGSGMGSFINMAVFRIRKGQNFFGRSYCDFCKKPLKAKSLIPIISYFVFNKKSECCHKKLSMFYPITEGVLGVIFAYLGFIYLTEINLTNTINLIYFSVIVLILSLVFVYDLKYYEIPVLPIFLGYIFYFLHSAIIFFIFLNSLIQSYTSASFGKYLEQAGFFEVYKNWFIQQELLNIGAAIFTLIFFLLIFFITKGRGLGFGDVYTAPLLSLIVGFNGTGVFLISSFTIGSVVGIFLVLFKGKNLKSRVPLGPFLIIGTIVALTFNRFLNIFNLY